MNTITPGSTFKVVPFTLPEDKMVVPYVRGHINAFTSLGSEYATIETVFGKYLLIDNTVVYLLNKDKTIVHIDRFKENIIAAERTLKLMNNVLFVDNEREVKLSANFGPFGGKMGNALCAYLEIDGPLVGTLRLVIGENKHEIFNFNPALDRINNITKFAKFHNQISQALIDVKDFKEHQYDNSHSSVHIVSLYFDTLVDAVKKVTERDDIDLLDAFALAEVWLMQYPLTYSQISYAQEIVGGGDKQVNDHIKSSLEKVENFGFVLFQTNNDFTIMLKKLDTLTSLVEEQHELSTEYISQYRNRKKESNSAEPMSAAHYSRFIDYIRGNELEDFVWMMPRKERYLALKTIVENE